MLDKWLCMSSEEGSEKDDHQKWCQDTGSGNWVVVRSPTKNRGIEEAECEDEDIKFGFEYADLGV